jgi:hypothetical protein
MKRIILIILALAIVGAFITWKVVFRKSDTSVASKKADVEITADSLFASFEGDETKANSLYLNKIVLVSGLISEVTVTETGYSVYLKNPDDISGILCGFNGKLQNEDNLKTGAVVKIKGICTGYLMDVVLNKCSLEK